MKKRDLQYFCETFYASHYMPVALFKDDEMQQLLCAQPQMQGVYETAFKKFQKGKSPQVFASNSVGLFGCIKVKNSNYTVLVGPSFVSTVTDKLVAEFMTEFTVENAAKDIAKSYLTTLPQITYNQFLNMVLLFNFTLNGEQKSMADYFEVTKAAYTENIATTFADISYQNKENDEHVKHGTYEFERQMLSLIRNGEPELLREFLLQAAKMQKLNEGVLADNALRQSKNIFLGLVTMVGKDAAIKGGMDIEETYQLIDLYTQECEKCVTIDAVKNLEFNMVIDFANRVQQVKVPQDISQPIFKAMQYIKTHTNTQINIDDIVAQVGYSRAWLCTHFKKELGVTVNDYIIQSKLAEAKRLLAYTDKPIVTISNYLFFSSQSYFQNLFKKAYGLTPKEYRAKHQH